MSSSYNSIKAEIQGNRGLLKLLKQNVAMPTTEEMAFFAQVELKKDQEFNISIDVDATLEKLLQLEYDLFKQKEQEILSMIIEYADKEATKAKYPKTRELIDFVKNEIKNGKDIISLSKLFAPIWFATIESNRQSKVTRAGHSLMHHLNFLFSNQGFVLGNDYQKNFKVQTYPLDFFFPDIKNFHKDPLNCCAIACQTTINDKVKKIQSELPDNVRRRVCTAIGSNNFGDNAVKDLSTNRLNEAAKENYKFVILESSFKVNPELKEHNSVMTYKAFFKDLMIVKNLWV